MKSSTVWSSLLKYGASYEDHLLLVPISCSVAEAGSWNISTL